MHQLLFIIFVTASTVCVGSSSLFTCDFSSGTAGDYLERAGGGATLSAMPDGGKCLEIAGTVKWVMLKPVAIQAGKKYKLFFRGRVNGEGAVEKNDRIHIMTLRSYGRYAASYQILFFDENDKKVSAPGYGCGGFIITEKWHNYVNVFYAPPRAKTLKIQFQTNGHTVFVDDIDLSIDTEGDAINCNPDFRYGELNYCGWRPAKSGRLYLRPDGKTVLKTGYAGSSPRFPLRDDSAYKMYARGKGLNKKAWLTLYFFDENGKRIGSRFLLRPSLKGGSVELVPPPGTRSGSVSLYSLILEEFKVTLIGDKSKIKEASKVKKTE